MGVYIISTITSVASESVERKPSYNSIGRILGSSDALFGCYNSATLCDIAFKSMAVNTNVYQEI